MPSEPEGALGWNPDKRLNTITDKSEVILTHHPAATIAIDNESLGIKTLKICGDPVIRRQ